MIGGINPWLAMWTQPGKAIRTIVNLNPRYGVLILASIYALQNFFFLSNYWSLGLSTPFFAILVAGVVLCPFLGTLWLYIAGWIFHFTGRWLEGKAPMAHLRAAIAWSKIPSSVSLLMWFILLTAQPESVFILDVEGPSSIFINFITLILGTWSLILLIQTIRKIQNFSCARAIINVAIAWIFSSLLYFLLFAFLGLLFNKQLTLISLY